MKRFSTILCAGALLLALTACSAQTGVTSAPDARSNSSSGQNSQSEQSSQSSSDGSSLPAQSGQDAQTKTDGTQEQTDDTQTDAARVVTLYIGSGDQFQQYQETYQGALNDLGMVPPEGVVAEMAELTGWNLDLAGEITTGKGGITVTFAETCALFSGPPEVQKDEFHVYDSYQLDQTILDSVKKTLQNWAVVPGKGDPDSVDIYYCGPDGKDLVLINSGWTISSTQPYEQFPQGN